MYNKGEKCEYTCEILEGSEGKPIYKVTPGDNIS